MTNITIRFAGGLGNQLFQLFAAIYISKKIKNSKIFFDTRFLSKYDTVRSFEINFILKALSSYSFVNEPFYGDSYFELSDGDQRIPGRLKISTSSFEVLVEHLVKFNINNKAPGYNKKFNK